MKKISKATKSNEAPETGEVTASKTCKCSIDTLTVSFQSEDMNKVVEKINEIIDKSNECTI